jgi:molybdenum-dependent DNA-binding transcriptional regulator ModE
MSQTKLEERISALERTVAELVQSRRPRGRSKDWRRTVGIFSGNELMKEIDAAGQKIREADRQRARRPRVRSQRTQK